MEKKVRLLVIISLLLISLGTVAQNASNESKFVDRLVAELNVGVGTKCNGVSPLELSANLGYRFIPHMYAFVHAGGLYGLSDDNHGQTYSKSCVLGGGLGYTLYQVDNVGVDLRGTVSSSIGDADWKHVVYDAALIFHVGGKLKMNLGLGFRHINSRTAGVGNYNGFYGTIGFGI